MSNRDSKDVKRPRKNKRARKHFSKKSTVSLHFSKRCLQRLGYIPDESALIKKIQENKLEFLSRQSCRVSRWNWKDPVSGTECILVYDKMRTQIITVLFKELYELRKENEVENVSSGTT